jgi:hypothetical protein
MTLPMLETFRLEIAQISLSLDVTDDPVAIQNSTRQYPQPNEFVYLRIKITNLSGMSFFSNSDIISSVHADNSVVDDFYHGSRSQSSPICDT